MMYPFLGSSFVGFSVFHLFGCLLLASGVILLLAWAIRFLPQHKLKLAALWCVGIGLVLVLLSALLFPVGLWTNGTRGTSRPWNMMQWLDSTDTNK